MKDIIKVSIEICIEASTEIAAREYASIHGINATNRSPWRRHPSGDGGGRLYFALNSSELPEHAEIVWHVVMPVIS
jgi:hypothetical protein